MKIIHDQVILQNKNPFSCPKPNPASDIRFPIFTRKWKQHRAVN